MIDSRHPGLSLRRQCRLLSVNRSSVYYKPRPISTDDPDLMKLIDDEYMKRPTSGSRTMRDFLERQGRIVNRKRIRRLMRQMGLEAVYPRPKTSMPHPEHRIYPCLLKGVISIGRIWSGQVISPMFP